MDEKTEVYNQCEEHAKKNGILLNPKKAFVESIVTTLIKNKAELGYGLCPCRIPSGDKKIDADYTCPCVPHLEDIKKQGHCHCFLYLKKEDTDEESKTEEE